MRLQLEVVSNVHKDLVSALGWNAHDELYTCSDDKTAARQMTLDAAALGTLEGLHGHAAAARIRLPESDRPTAKRARGEPSRARRAYAASPWRARTG